MKILAIDTSCDDTCVAIVEIKNKKIKVLNNIVSSQVKIHKKYGGVFPFLAKREHQKNLLPILKFSLKKSKLLLKNKKANRKIENLEKIISRENFLNEKLEKFLKEYKVPKIDLICVTEGPGLEPCLWTGINFAKILALFWKKPILGINHLEGHIFANFTKKFQILNTKSKIFPAVALIVSGGHTELVLIKNIKKYNLLGETLDDAAGECLDKVAKMINLPYPGGPEIEKIAKKGNPIAYNFPRPMLKSKDFNFSFSGLKTAILYTIKKIPKSKIKKEKKDIAASAQQAVIDTLIEKTIRAAIENKAKTIILGGGVAANQKLKYDFKKEIKKRNLKIGLIYPSKKLCTDNALMIAVVGFFHKKKAFPPEIKNLNKIKANPNLNF